MRLCLVGCACRYELENILRLFFPYEPVTPAEEEDEEGCDGVFALARRDGGEALVRLRDKDFCKTARARVREDPLSSLWGRPEELALSSLLYGLLVELCGREMPWGMITGVRPVKLLRRLTARAGEAEAKEVFLNRLRVSGEKTALALRTLRTEDKVIALSRPMSCSVYISIPFCPSRCAYCSFVSHSSERSLRLIPSYIPLLCEEIALTGEMVRELGLRVETVYIGGGTPTVLSARQLSEVMDAVAEAFDVASLREYTVEAGRPDTVDAEKLAAISRGGAGRISVNPQTLSDEVLRRIGRRHTADDFFRAFALARETGDFHINTDIIAGLPGDTPEGFAQTLDGVLSLSPESVTVHTLSLKRGSFLRDERVEADTARMVRRAGDRLSGAGYAPYYLYRQSRCVGGQENTGWSVPGREGLYNVFMMDETHTVFGCGAGAVTKLKSPHGERLARVFPFKYPYEYIGRFEEIRSRKREALAFYAANA